jgi:hypothetical protein
MFWYNDSDYIPIATSQTPLQLLVGVEIMWTLLLTYDGFPQSSNYRHMQGDYSWSEWKFFFVWSNDKQFGNGHDNTKACGEFCGQGNHLRIKPWLQNP